MQCSECGTLIPPERIEALPDTTTCVGCSQVKGYTENDIDLDGADSHDLRQVVRGPEREKQ